MSQPTARVCGQLLQAGRLMEPPAALLLALCCAMLAMRVAPAQPLLVSLGCGLAGLYVGFRIRFDAAVFEQYAQDGSWAPFDEGLAALGLRKAQTQRQTGDRAQGALRLLRWRIVWLAAQLASCALAGAFRPGGLQ